MSTDARHNHDHRDRENRDGSNRDGGNRDREIRRVSGEEFLDTGRPIQAYAFGPSPAPSGWRDRQRDDLAYRADHTNLVAFAGGRAEAVASAIPMRQNVRGSVLAMAGVSGVATHPEGRRRGHVRALLGQLHADMRDAGHAVATLYPFRASFYERFGYVGFPRPRRIRLSTDSLAPLLDTDVSGASTVHRIGSAFPDLRRLCEALLAERHGFCLEPPSSMRKVADEDRHWLALAWGGDDPVGAMTYTMSGHGGEIAADTFLSRSPHGRALLLRWLAKHVDQVSSVTLELAPDARPERWITDVSYTDETRVGVPDHNPPMGRVLSVEALSGLAVGEERVTVEVVDDPLVGGVWTLDGSDRFLEVHRGGDPTGTLTSHGLAALVYGVLDPAELPFRGYGSVDRDTEERLRTLFPPATPYLYSSF